MRDRLSARAIQRAFIAVLLAAGAAVAATALGPAATIRPGSAVADGRTGPGMALDIALTGTASASVSQSGSPPANAIDGSASSSWCSTQWTGTLTVDLGKVRSLSGFGLTLGSNATTAAVNWRYATVAGQWQQPADLQQMSVPAGDPIYLKAPGDSVRARYVQIDVTDNDGTPPCVGELRLFAREPWNTIPDRGADLSFEAQEEAAGAHFTDRGRSASPL
jgi:hypothetical protein